MYAEFDHVVTVTPRTWRRFAASAPSAIAQIHVMPSASMPTRPPRNAVAMPQES